MVAIVSGDSLGLSLSSLATLGQGGTSGTSGSGRNGEQAFVNAANGNLVLQIQDDYLASIGADVSSLRTYNSQGQLAGQDSWAVGAERQRIAPVADSTSKLIRTERDGATAVYEWSGSASAFLSTAGDGAYDSIVAENGGYIWTDGATGLKEHFGTTGRLIRSEDADGQIITYGYTDGRLTTVTDASGEKVDYRYDNGLLTSIKTTLADGTSASRVSYTYDAGRLQTATVDLSTQDGGVPVGRVYETRYTYEGSSQRVASITQSDGTSLAFTYTLVDGQYRVASVKDGLHHITSYAYDLAARQTTVIDPVGLVTVYTYDDKAQLKRVETGDVSASPSSLATTTIELAVDPVQVTSSTDAQGVTTLSWQQPATATHTLWRYRAQGSGDQGWSTLNPASSNGMQTVVLPSPALGPFEYELLLTPEGSSVPTGRAIGTYEVVSVTQGRYETIHHEVPKVEVQILAGTGFGQSRMEWSAPANATTTWRYRPAGNATAAWSSLNVETANGKQWVDLSGLAAGSHDFELVETANGVPVGHAVGTLAITTQQAVYLTMAPAQHPVTAGQGSNGQPQLSWTLPPQGTTTTFKYKNAAGWQTLAVVNDTASGKQFANLAGIAAGSYQYEMSQSGGATALVRGTVQVLPTVAAHTETQQLPIGVLTVTASSNGLSWAAPASGTVTTFRYRTGTNANWTTNTKPFTLSGGVQSLPTSSLQTSTQVEFEVLQGPSGGRPTVHATGLYYLSGAPGTTTPEVQVGQVGQGEGPKFVTGPVTTTYPVEVSIPAYTPIRELSPSVTASLNSSSQPQLSWDMPVAGTTTTLKYRSAGGQWQTLAIASNTAAGQQVASFATVPAGNYEYQMEQTGATPLRVTGTVQVYAKVAAHTKTQQLPVSAIPVTGGSGNAGLSWPAALNGTTTTLRYRPSGRTTWSTYTDPFNYVGNLKQIKFTDVKERGKWVEFEVLQTAADGTPTAHAVGRYYANNSTNAVTVELGQVGTTGQSNYVIVGPTPTTRTAQVNVAAYTPSPVLVGSNVAQITAPNALPSATLSTPLTREISVWVEGGLGAVSVSSSPVATVNVDIPYYAATSTIQGRREVRSFEYNASGDVLAVVNGNGEATVFEYDAQGNRQLQRDMAGNTVTRTYNAANQLASETTYRVADPDGAGAQQPSSPQTAHFVHDPSNATRLRFAVSAQGRVTQYRYDGYGQQTAVLVYGAAAYSGTIAFAELSAWADAQTSGVERTDKTYDARGLLASVTGQTTTRYFYDPHGRLLEVVDGADNATQYSYDGLGRVYKTRNAANEDTLTDYIDAANRVTVTMANGLSTTSFYDKAGQLVSQLQSTSSSPNLGTTRYSYDAANRLVMTTDPTGVRNFILYDEQGRKAADIDGDGSLTEYIYDGADRLVRTIQYATAVNLNLLVDSNGRALQRRVADIRQTSPASDRSNWRVHDAAGRLAMTVDADGAVTQYTYDGASRLVRTWQYAEALQNLGALGDQPALTDITPTARDDDRVSRNFYDADGLLFATLDGEGYLTELTYKHSGRLAQRLQYAGATSVSHRATGTLEQLRADAIAARQATHPPLVDRATWLLYNATGQLVGEVDGDGHLTETAYDAAGNVSRTSRYADRVSSAKRSQLGINSVLADVLPAPGAPAQTTLYAYDELNRLELETDHQGTQTKYEYTAGQLTKTFRALATADQRELGAEYDAQGRQLADIDGEGFAQVHSYDSAGRRVSTQDALGNKTLFFYNVDGQLTHTIDQRGAVTERQYDTLGQLKAEVRYATQLSAATRATLAGGLVNSTLTTAVNGIKRASMDSSAGYTYTNAGRLREITDAAGFKLNYAYNAFGEQSTITCQISATSSVIEELFYDRRGLLLESIRDSESGGIAASTSRQYDAFGRLVRSTDANGNVRTSAYGFEDGVGRFVTTLNVALGEQEKTAYDAFNRVVRHTVDSGGLNLTTTYTYSATERSTRVRSAEGHTTTTYFTRLGQTRKVTDSDGETNYSYDKNGNLKTHINALDLVAESDTYDKVGRLVETVDANGVRTTIAYDDANGTETRTVDPGGLNLRTVQRFDAKGQLASIEDPNGVITSFEYHPTGQLKSKTVDPTGLNLKTSYEYDGLANVLRVTSPAGIVTDYTYDKLGRRVEELVDPTALRLKTTYAYDGNGNLRTRTDNADNVTRYVYDAQDRLTYTVDAAGGVEYNAYDKAGRLVQTTRFANTIPLDGLSGSVTATTIEQRLDRAPARDAAEYRFYDRDGRVTSLRTALGGDRYGVVSFKYDAAGRVTERVAYAAEAVGASPVNMPVSDSARDMRLRAVYDALGRPTYTVDGVGAVTKREYDNNGNVLRLSQYANAVGLSADPASVLPSGADRVTIYTYDAANRAVFSVDALGGVVRNAYDANGNLTQRTAYAKAVTGSPSTAAAIEQRVNADPLNDRVERFAFDTAGRQVFAIDATGAVRETQYDRAGNATRSIHYATSIATTGLTPASTAADIRSRISASSAHDRAVTRAFDAANRLVYAVDPMGYARKTEYDALGRTARTVLYAIAIPVGTPATITAIGQAISPRLTEDRTESFYYDAVDRLESSTDGLGFSESHEYDALGRMLSFTNKNGDTWNYEYDAGGNRVQETAPVVARSMAGVDPAGNLTLDGASSEPVRPVTQMRYDALGNLLLRTEAVGLAEQRQTRYSYDALGRQVETIFPEVGVYNVQGDSASNGASGLAARVETRRALKTTTAYDALGNAIAGQDLAGNYSYKVYDKLGHVLYDVDAMGYVVGYERNAFGDGTKLTRYNQAVTASPGSQGFSQTTLAASLVSTPGVDRRLVSQYDRAGRVVKVTEPASFTYDSDTGATATLAKVTENSYNGFGELVRSWVVKPGGTGAAYPGTYHFFNRAGRQIATVDAGGYLSTQTWNAAGELLSRTEFATAVTGWNSTQSPPASPPSAAASSDDRTTRWTYDRAGRKTTGTRVQVEASANSQLYARADGSLALFASTPIRPFVEITTPDGTAGIAGAVALAGDNGSAVIQWPAPSDRQATIRWRLTGTEVWTTATDAVTTTGGTQRLFFAADMPPGTYDVELVYQGWDSWYASETYRITFYSPAAAQAPVLTGTTPTSGAASIPGVHLTQRDGLRVLQWPTPEDGTIVTLRFQAPGSSEWRDAVVRTEGGVQYVVVPDDMAAGNYKLQLDFRRFDAAPVNLTTEYSYDTVGNLTRTKDALGNLSYSYYDALGRVTAAVAPPTATGLSPLTEFFHDAHGNLLGTIARSASALAVSTASYTPGTITPGADRFDASLYDALGRVTQATDAGGISRFYSYNERGDLAKSWFSVSDADGAATIYQVRQYDKLGRLLQLVDPQPATLDSDAPGLSVTSLTYNAFGEMTGRSIDGQEGGEYFEYDNAGRLWQTNSGDGADRIMLYDVRGRMTQEIRGGGSGSVAGGGEPRYLSAVQASTASGLRRTVYQYDALGRVVKQILPQHVDTQDSLTLSGVSIDSQVLASTAADADTNRVSLAWTNLAPLGSGDIKVVLSYLGDGPKSITRTFTAEEAAAGAVLQWGETGDGGIESVTSVALYKKDRFGYWVSIILQHAQAPQGHALTLLAPVDPSTVVTVKARPLGASAASWLTLNTAHFGDRLFVNPATLLPAEYEYQVFTQRTSDASAYMTAIGTFDLRGGPIAVIQTPITSTGGWAAGVYGWQSPAANVLQTLRYRLHGSSEIWRSLPVTELGGGFSGVNASQLAPGAYDYELLFSQAGSLSPYAHASGQISILAAIGPAPLPVVSVDPDPNGTVTVRWQPVAGTTPVISYRQLEGQWQVASWPVSTQQDGQQAFVTPVELPPGNYVVRLDLVNSAGVAAFSDSMTVAITQGPVQPATWELTTGLPTSGKPPLSGVSFQGLPDGAWTLSLPMPPAGGHSELWSRAPGAAEYLRLNATAESGAQQRLTVAASELPPGLWEIVLVQVDSTGTRISQNNGTLTVYPRTVVLPTLTPKTPAYIPDNVPVITTTFAANPDGSWVLSWPKPTDATWVTTLRYRGPGTPSGGLLANIQESGQTHKIAVGATDLAPGKWEIELFQSKGTTLMARSLQTITIGPPPVFAAAALQDTTKVYQPALTVAPYPAHVPGIFWAANAIGSTFSWTKPTDDSVVIVNFRQRNSGNGWLTANTASYTKGSPQSLVVTTELFDGDWDIQISRVNLTTGVASSADFGFLRVTGGGSSHKWESTYPPVRDVKFEPVAAGGSTFSWETPPAILNLTSTFKWRDSGSTGNWNVGAYAPSGTRQITTVPADFPAGVYDVQIELTDSSGWTTHVSTGTLDTRGGALGHTCLDTSLPYTPAHFSNTQGAPKILTAFTTEASNGTWALAWETPPAGTTTQLQYRRVGSSSWLSFTSRIVTSGLEQKASFLPEDLAPGNYELDLFYVKNSKRVGQFTATLTTSSIPATRATQANHTPAYVPGPNIPQITPTFSSDSASGLWRLQWGNPPPGATMVVRWLVPGATEWTVASDAEILTGPDFRYIEGGPLMRAGLYKIDIAYMSGAERIGQYLGELSVPENGVRPTMLHVPTPIQVQFSRHETNGSWTVSWPHAPQGSVSTLTLRLRGSPLAPIVIKPSSIVTANGIDSLTVYNWDGTAGIWDLELSYSELAAPSVPTARASGTIVMHEVPRIEPTWAAVPSAYVPTQYLISQTTDPTSRVISVAQAFVPSAPPTAPGFEWMNTDDGGSLFRWELPPNTTAVFRYRNSGTGWTELPSFDVNTPAGMRRQVTVGPLVTPGQYEAELTLTSNGIVVGYAMGTLSVPVAAAQLPGGPAQPSGPAVSLPHLQPVIHQTRDRWGNTLEVSDVRHAAWITRYKYNANNQMVQQTQPNADGAISGAGVAVTRIYYDALGREIAVKDANGHVEEKHWDAAGHLLQETHADRGTVHYRYDIFGDKEQVTDEMSVVTTYRHDKLSRLVSTTYAPVDVSRLTNTGSENWVLVTQASMSNEEIIEYDEAGRKTRIHSAGGEVLYRYDLRGNVARTTQGGISTEYAYDALGRKIAERDGNMATATWRYDYFGRLKDHTDIGGASYSYGYDNAMQLLSVNNSRIGQVQSVGYTYDAAGRLIRIEDHSTNKITEYQYDLAGNRIREQTTQAGVVYQDNHLAYDALGRLRWVADGRAYVLMEYDLVGNRTRIQTHVINGDATQDSDRHFQYDTMNRQVVADAADAEGHLGVNGHAITYDKAGRKTSDTWQGNVVQTVLGTPYTQRGTDGDSSWTEVVVPPNSYRAQLGLTTETYSYDALGRLKEINRDGTVVDQRFYDAAGRTVQSGKDGLAPEYLAALNGTKSAGQPLPGNGSEIRKTLYDSNGHLLAQQVLESNADTGSRLKYMLFYSKDDNTANIDGAGNLMGYKLSNYEAQYGNQYSYSYKRMEGYKEESVTGTRIWGSDDQATGTTSSSYDGNGFLVQVLDSGQSANSRFFVNDAAGKVLYGNQGGHVQRQLIANGEVLGRYGYAVDDKAPAGQDGVPVFGEVADFAFGFEAQGGKMIGDLAPASHLVSAGDTLQSIAQGYYGDSRLWYRIAEANGLAGNQDVRPGQVLRLPATESAGNASHTFKPYEPGKVVGDTTPFLPMPMPSADGGCGGVGQIIMIVVAIIVTIYTAGAAAGMFGASTAGGVTASSAIAAGVGTAGGVAGATFGVGTSVLAGGYGAAGLAAAAVGGAVGSIASQVVGIAIGAQDKFSWKGVALGALSAGVTAGVGSLGALAGQSIPAVMARAAVGSAISQGIGVATGLQKSFDWRGVAASAVAAGVGQGINDNIMGAEQFGPPAPGQTLSRIGGLVQDWGGGFGAQLAGASLKGLMTGTAAAVMRGGKIAIQQVATDAFGNALGSSLAGASSGAPVAQAGDPLGEFIDNNMPAWQQRQANFDQVVDAFSNARQINMGEGDLVAAGDGFTMGKKISVTERGRSAYIDADDLTGLSDAELMSRAKALVGGAGSGGRGTGGSREWSASTLYQQGLGDIREYSNPITAGAAANGGGDLWYPHDGGGTLVGQRMTPAEAAAFDAAQDSPVKQIYNDMNERLSGMVSDAQDQYVQNGARSSGWQYGLNAAGYVASEFFPRSVGAAAFAAVGGPIVGRVVGWGSRAAVSAFPVLGREVGAIVESGLNRFAVPRGGVTSTNPSLATLQPPVRPARPSWRVSELDLEALNGQGSYSAQASFLKGLPVPRGTRGSTRPDLYRPGESIDIKNYNLATAQGQRNLVRDVVAQAQHRAQNLPAGDVQKLVIDARGQSVSTVTLNRLAAQIQQRSNSIIGTQDIQFWR